MMRALLRLVPILSCLGLVACGGGGGDSGGAAQPPQPVALSVNVGSSSLGVTSITDVVVNVSRRGTGVPDGTPVTLSVDQPSMGQVGAATGENQSFNNSASAPTTGGQARFRFKSSMATGTVQLRASVADPGAQPATATISLNGGPSNDTRLTLQANRQTIPVNAEGLPPSCRDFPYQAEVTVTWRNLRGELVTAPEDEEAMRAVWTSEDNVGALSTPDDPDTDENECEMYFASTRVVMNAGRGTVLVRSLGNAGSGRLTVSVVDQDTGENLSAEMPFTMTSGVPGIPGTVRVAQEGPPAYVQGSGGSTSRQLRIFVDDGAGNPVPNPVSGSTSYNNVRLEILDQEGERLSVTTAAGVTQEGHTVSTRTFNGVAGALFRTANRQGIVRIRATADRADNNVDNGITDPVVGEGSVVVSDGQLFSVTLTTPVMDSLFVNRTHVLLPEDDDENAPADGTYSLIVSAIATDRMGNPVLPGTTLQFGLIDSPLAANGNFALFGMNGDPQEGGTLFSASNGAFTTAGGGVGPGDTLVLFGKDVTGNEDLEGSRVVQSVSSATSLSVTRRFNFNDHTGQSVNRGPVVPYAIGRAQVGNIHESARTNANGVATVYMNYPVTHLGRAAIVWVQGNGAVVSGEPKTVGDVEFYSFAGLAPAQLMAAPESITANQASHVMVCLSDARGEAMRGASIGFAFQGLTSGSGSITGQGSSGVVGPTDASGCVGVTAVTTGIQAGGGNPSLVFFVGGAQAVVEIVGGEEPEDPGSTETVTLTVNITGETGNVQLSSSENSFSPPRPSGLATCERTSTAAPTTTCTYEIVLGRSVGLTAMPTGGSAFGAWSGDCAGGAATVSQLMNGDRSCTANFVP
jgi:hypothetical protein